ncbi:PREDICTED: basic leucine zipper 43-like [Camelina sativa]|uniref:Basic leucine zipper 43-like n=1 Tax=Camelina sativa TaxID=90675 RepID=A0ABM0VZT3_CAMSA|nr:PREDICTED: basic leucine zipper 43-like [Camelina sativa]
MSTISPVLSSEPILSNQLPAWETGFTSWGEESDLFSIFNSPVSPMEINPGLDKTNPSQIQNQRYSSPGLKDKQPLHHTSSNGVSSDKDERRKKRKLSNRKSAQRSRIKKQKHLEDVRSKLNQLKFENRELDNRRRYVLYHCERIKMENDRLRLEHHALHEKLLNLRQALVMRQIQQNSTCATWSCVNSTIVTVNRNPSMMRDHVI